MIWRIYLQVELGLKKLAGLIECFFLCAWPSPVKEEEKEGEEKDVRAARRGDRRGPGKGGGRKEGVTCVICWVGIFESGCGRWVVSV